MCIFRQPKRDLQETGTPEQPGEQADIGSARKAENEDLYGGVPDLRVDRSATDGGVGSSGSGLRMM